jgi:hypothetical protein
MSDKYPLTEKKVELQKPTLARWQYTLSGWLRLIRTPCSEEGTEMEIQITSRMFEDKEFDRKIRDEFEAWLAEEPQEPLNIDPDNEFCSLEGVEDKMRRQHAKSFRDKGWKGSQRGKRKPKC